MLEVCDTRSMLIKIRSSIPDIVVDFNQSNNQTWNDMFHDMIKKFDLGSEYPKGSVPNVTKSENLVVIYYIPVWK